MTRSSIATPGAATLAGDAADAGGGEAAVLRVEPAVLLTVLTVVGVGAPLRQRVDRKLKAISPTMTTIPSDRTLSRYRRSKCEGRRAVRSSNESVLDGTASVEGGGSGG